MIIKEKIKLDIFSVQFRKNRLNKFVLFYQETEYIYTLYLTRVQSDIENYLFENKLNLRVDAYNQYSVKQTTNDDKK
ncbi:hypothetical protein BpHYR1_027220 [Brachionus plicatilis]|uniref:Uncharacterized protein n=1 Tax=Brachionus plicatilis TaxID=10195 RepID=A0A3M7T8I7_BRAPC|nr:hypothetical protein BpHYR1_027220 [Brachionus plicatilis]